MPHLVDLVREATRGDNFDLELAALDSDDPEEIATLLSDFLSARLASVEDGVFYHRGTGIVAGALLSDGRLAVMKVHRWRVSIERLSAVQSVQEQLALAGLPAPRPMLAPEALGAGIATVEEMRRGSPADGHHPTIRRAIAEGLYELVVAARPLRNLTELGQAALFGPQAGWPEPHDLRFDFDTSVIGAEWIDELARDARGRLQGSDREPVVGHMDWCAGNLGFDGDRCAAIYDWDSLAVAPEPVVVGAAAAQFCADWSSGAVLPSLAEMRIFVREYEEARSAHFDFLERDLLDAANILQCAYGARCQHSDVVLGAAPVVTDEGGWIGLLRERATSPLFE